PGLRIRVMETAAHAWREFRRLSRMTYTYRFWVYLMHQWHEQFTRPGRWVIVAGLATAVTGGFPEAMVGSIGFSSFAALIFLSAAVSLVRKPPVAVSRRISDRYVAGAETTVHITVHNVT